MLEALRRVFAGRTRWEIALDVLDVAIVAYLIYRVLLIVRGTRAMQMGVGLGVILLLSVASKSFGLITLQSLLSYVLSSIILIVVVVFQNDIRRALIRVGGQAWLGRGKRQQSRVIDEVVAAVTECARHRIGAIIAFEQDANLGEFTKRDGVELDAAVTRELLVAIFYPESVNKLHDGAVVIRNLKIARAGVFFPMLETKALDTAMGTRHQAALGITEETDAVVVVVSEERGTISFCFNGNIVPNLDGTSLRQALVGILEQKPATGLRALTNRQARIAPALANAAPLSSGPTSSPPSVPPPASASPIPSTPTATPLPRNAPVTLAERARVEAERSALPEAARARRVSTPMPRTTKSILPGSTLPADVLGEDGHDEDRETRPPPSSRSPMPLDTDPESHPPPVPPTVDHDSANRSEES
ncbi:MAG: diadenylate cyclase CdaA [Polyangiaceae bacterium]